MRRQGKQLALDTVQKLHRTHENIRNNIDDGEADYARQLLSECQQSAIELGNMIEQTEGEDFSTVRYIEDYCELLYNDYQALENLSDVSANKIFKTLRKNLIQIENSIRNDIKIRLEAVFLPYKASMWDSLESIWKAADADPDCDAYVVPISYYDKNPDGSYKKEHYEGDLYPDYVPVTGFNEYDIEKRHPDIIFIHNPYDNNNLVTSVHPDFFSDKLKKCTELLVYVPYYSTTGGMSEGQRSCPAYYNADYIIIQADKYRGFFDAALPQDKLLALGSPKFDRVINICKNPPEPPADWKEKTAGKKVYFYNTSIGGILGNTEKFLKKMKYVFKCFEGRNDACLIWRPHPLLESTLDSMRMIYKEEFLRIKAQFISSGTGIYDETPDITNTIALCDAYVGDSGTSVTSLFGIAGKPLFILHNNIDAEPEENDWRGQIINGFSAVGSHKWLIVSGTRLYHSPDDNYKYEYYCDLSEYSGGYYYSQVIEINGKNYVCPANANDILVVDDRKIVKRISLSVQLKEPGAFYGALRSGDYLILLPNKYPVIVRYNTVTGKLDYLNKDADIILAVVNGERRFGGACERDGHIYIGSPVSPKAVDIEVVTGKETVLEIKSANYGGCMIMQCDGEKMWIMPYTGNTLICWNPADGSTMEYACKVEGFECFNPILGYKCGDRPFGCCAFYNDYVYVTPYWGNEYIRINRQNGEIVKWCPPFERTSNAVNGYFFAGSESTFIYSVDGKSTGSVWRLFSIYDRRLYDVNFETNEYKEIPVEFNLDELKEKTDGFSECSEWVMYACVEDAFNSLPDFLDGNITGNQFDKDRQFKAYSQITANYDGTCGAKVYDFMREKLRQGAGNT